MITNPLTGLLSNVGASNQNISRSTQRFENAVATLSSGNKLADVASQSQAAQLQGEISGLRSASLNLAQTSSLGQVADGALEGIANAINRLQEIGVQSNSGALDDNTRELLDIEFQDLLSEIDRQVENTQFNSQPLLDGSLDISLQQTLGEESSDNDNRLTLESLSVESLFNGEAINVRTQENAENALETLKEALSAVTSARAEVGSFLETTNFANANLQSAIQNQVAAASTLTDADFATASTELSLADLQQNASVALKAQSNNQTGALLSLINTENT